MESGFISYHKSKGDNRPLLDNNCDRDNNNTAYISVYQTEFKSWGKFVRVGNTNKLLVAFA